MRRLIGASSLAAALTLAAASIALADEPSQVDVALPEDTTLCAGEERPNFLSFVFAVKRSATGPQLSNGATLRLSVPFDQAPATREVGIYQFNTGGDISVTLPDDWASLPEGTLSDGVEYFLSLLGEGPGVLQDSTLPWVIEVVSPTEESFEFLGTLDGFEVVDCTPPPQPSVTIAPTDAVEARTGRADLYGLAVAVVVAASALTWASLIVRRRQDRS